MSGLAARRLEYAAALAACLLVSFLLTLRLLEPNVFSDDALVHQFWMWRFRDAGLFTDPLTAALRESSRYPDGYEALFRLATHLAGPIVLGEWLGIALMAASAFLVFLVVRELEDWRPAAWIAAGLFLLLVDIHRFHGGFPRAFVHPVVLLTVLLALRRRELPAALVAASGALFYPPAMALAGGALLVSCVGNRRRLPYALLALGLGGALVLLGGETARVLTADEARGYPEFGADGPLHFFVDSPVDYLRQNRSGFDLRGTGSILVLAAAALLLVRRANRRLLPAEVWALPVVALLGYAAAQLVLFKLYLPHRYTYPIVAFCAIAVAVTLRPTWEAVRGRPQAAALLAAPVAVAALALYAFPLGPLRAPGWAAAAAGAALLLAAVALAPRAARTPALGALLTGVVLLALMAGATERWDRGSPCAAGPAQRYLASLPKDAVIAGDPRDLTCLPGTARRAVVISTQLAPSYEVDYFLQGRERMFATLRAYYGRDPAALRALGERYGVTHLWVRRGALQRELTGGGARWRAGQLPYGRYVRDLLRAGDPAVLRLPAACRSWRRGGDEVYDLACLGDHPVTATS